jgi:TP901 family phage tail tape measure protein
VADIVTTFDGDGRPLENVIGRLSKEFVDFAKTAQSSFDSVQGSVDGLSAASDKYGQALDRNIAKVKKLESASTFPAVGSSSIGLGDSQIRSIQAGMSESTRGAAQQARELADELERASKVRFNDDQVAAIQSGLSESRTQASELAKEIRDGAQSGGASTDFLKQQVDQYNAILEREREINSILEKRLSKSKEIEKAIKPQGADTSSQIGLTEDQVKRVQAALAESPRLAKELTEEFLRQNAALGTGTDLVKKTGTELVKYTKSSGELVKVTKSSGEMVKYVAQVTQKTKDFAEQTSRARGFLDDMKGLWSSLNALPDLPSLRYALYDIKNTFDRISKAARDFAVEPIGMAVQYEREFANVVRTNELVGDDMEGARKKLQQELLTISKITPIPWEEVTNIATLAGQLGIAEDLIVNFTDTTARFAATTDLTVNAAATAFGRLNQLIKGVDGNFEALGSAILAVGVDSVATESQIVNVSTQIASMSNLAGLTASEIVGLSGALASLGVSPELSRGVVTRLFSQIGKSAAEGGFNVEDFGRITGRTAEQFVQDWSTRPGEVLQDFFDGINNEGPRAERTLRQLGITSVRDIPTILRLAQNSEEVSRLIGLSAEEYANATKLTEQYGIISGTAAEQIKRLSQNFQTLSAAVGSSIEPLLGPVLQLLNNAVQGLTGFLESDFGKFISGTVIVISLLVSALTGFIASMAGTLAAMIAMRFAAKQLGFDLTTLIKATLGNKAAMDALTTSTAISTTAMRGFRAVLFSLGALGALIGVLGLVFAHFGSIGDEAEDADARVSKFHGSLDGLAEAVRKDTENFDELSGKMKDGTDAITTFDTEIKKTTNSFVDASKVAGDFVVRNEAVEESVEGVTEAVEKQTNALGENALAYTQQKLLEQPELVDLFADADFAGLFQEANVSVAELLEASLEGEQQEIIDVIVGVAKQSRDALVAERAELNRALTSGENIDMSRYEEISAEIERYNNNINSLTKGTLPEFLQSNAEMVGALQRQADATANVTGATEEMQGKLFIARQELDIIRDTLFGSSNYTKRAEDAINSYGNALKETGSFANEAGGEIDSAISAILSEPEGNVEVILANLGTLMRTLQNEGPKTASAQQRVADTIQEIGISAGLTEDQIKLLTSAMGTISAAPLGAINTMKQAVIDLGQAFSASSGTAVIAGEQMGAAIDAIISAAGDDVGAAIAGLDGFFEAIVEGGLVSEQELIKLGERILETYRIAALARQALLREEASALSTSSRTPEELARWRQINGQIKLSEDSVRKLEQALQQAGSSTEEASKYAALLKKGYDGAAASAGKTAENAAQVTQEVEVARRTVVDFGNDLRSVAQRATEIRFGRMLSLDRLTDSWKSLRDGIDAARESLQKLIQTQRELSADRAIKEYFLSVATAYGDTLRAAKLREELAALDKQQIENSKQLSEAIERSSGDINGNTEAARKNRQELTNLLGNYQDYIATLAATGAKKKELQAATNQARADFISQATELGFQIPVVFEYAEAFGDLFEIIRRFKPGVNVGFNLRRGIGRQALREFNATRSYSSGGYTGPGGKYEVAGTVHKGEYVVPRELVNQSTGLPNFLDQMQNMPGYRPGGVGGGTNVSFPDAMIVELSPYDRKLLAEAGNVQLRLNGRVVAEATNANNLMDARRGSN